MILVWVCTGFLLLSISLLVWSSFRARRDEKYLSLCTGFIVMSLMGLALVFMCVFEYFDTRNVAEKRVQELLEQRDYLQWQIDCLDSTTPSIAAYSLVREVREFNETVSRYQELPYNFYNGVLYPKDYEVIELIDLTLPF